MSTAGDVDAGPAGTHHRKKGPGRGGFRTELTSPREENGRQRKLVRRLNGICLNTKLQVSKEIWGKAREVAGRQGGQSD